MESRTPADGPLMGFEVTKRPGDRRQAEKTGGRHVATALFAVLLSADLAIVLALVAGALEPAAGALLALGMLALTFLLGHRISGRSKSL